MRIINHSIHINRIIGLDDNHDFGTQFLRDHAIKNNPPRLSMENIKCNYEISPNENQIFALAVAWDICHQFTIGNSYTTKQLGNRLDWITTDSKNKTPSTGLGTQFLSDMPITEPRKDENFIKGWLYAKGFRITPDRIRALIATIDLIRITTNPTETHTIHRSFTTYDNHEVIAPSEEEAATMIESDYDQTQLRDNIDFWEIEINP